MRNVNARVEGTNLILTVDMSQDLGPSKSGKSIIVASTGGNVSVENVKVGLNVYRPR
jgi:hypothetical protein